MDATVAYRQACLNAINYLKKFRLHRRASLRDSRHRAGRRSHQRHRGYSERVRHAVRAVGDLQFPILPNEAGPKKFVTGKADLAKVK